MYTISEEVMQNDKLTPAAKLVHSIIYTHVADEEKNISYNTIAKKASLTNMTVIRCVQILEDEGLIEVTKSARGWNLYRVISQEETMLVEAMETLGMDVC